MSDFHKTKQKLQEGIEWRGSINVSIDEETHKLSVRQLSGPEFEEVMHLVDLDELKAFQEALPSDVRDELHELQDKEELDEEEEARMAELEEQLKEAGVNIFDYLSTETFEGIRKCALYGVEPDDEDMQYALKNRASAIEEEFGVHIKYPEDTREPLKQEMQDLIRRSPRMTSFTIGIQVFMETLDEEGN